MLSKDQVLEIIQNELSQAETSTTLQSRLEEDLGMYLGNPDGREIEGRSHVVSTDVADAIEWIMPQVMKSFTQNNEVVIFDPVHEGDEYQAELESEYVYEVLMKQNDGFIILHQFVKDALMQKNGILKVYYAEHNKRKIVDWTGLTEAQLQMLLSRDGVELLEMVEDIDEQATFEKREVIKQHLTQLQQTAKQDPVQAEQILPQIEKLTVEMENPVKVYDVKVAVERKKGQIYVDPIPRENFRINARHNSINTEGARFTAHVFDMTRSEAIQEFDLSMEELEDLPESGTDYSDEYRFTLQEGSVFAGDDSSDDEAEKTIEISECFMRIDIDQSGISKLMKITVAGGENGDVTDILDIEEIEKMPWVTTTAFLMSHKFEGLSVTDRLRQIQEQKTTLWRNMFDNMYLQNNQRNVIIENQVNMDDLLVSRPGGIIRAKRLDAIMPLQTPQLGQDAYNMIEYLDRVRAGRVGVDPDGGASPQNVGDRVGSEGVDRLMNAKEELVGLIVRVIAETGVKPLCIKIRDLSVNHINAVHDFRFRGVWQKINPYEWEERTKCTVRVGTGTGNHMEQKAALGQVLALQKELAAMPGNILVDEQRTFNTIDDFCKFSGLNGATRYFVDPSSPEGKQKSEQRDMNNKSQSEKEELIQIEMAKMQKQLADAETSKAESKRAEIAAKTTADYFKSQLENQKQASQNEMDKLKQKLDEYQAMLEEKQGDDKIELEKYRIDTQTALELTRIESDKQMEQNQNYKENKGDVSGSGN